MDERPEGAKFWVAKDVTDWIEKNVPAERLKENGYEHSGQAAIWWLAMSQAECYRDMNLRETAEMLVNGVTPLTLDDVTEELQARYDVSFGDVEVQGVNDEVERDLMGHFEVEEVKP